MPTAMEQRRSMPADDTLKERYESVRARIDEAAARSGRSGSDIILVAVTKYASIDQIRQLIGLGHVDLGESRAQILVQHAAQVEELLERGRELPSTRSKSQPKQVRWHMVGHLQRNKVRKIVDLVRLLHSVDSLRLAEEIQQVAAARRDEPVEVLIQVNVAGERQKHGVAPAATRHLIEQIDTMFNVRVRGLMCMAPEGEDPEAARAKARPVFTRCHELFDDIQTKGVTSDRFNILSMGMSGDYDVAVECGANVVRVGTAIFGVREDVR
ncbi:MAG: YggS family pyridoxal phosphate-dependent enzyme [Planctomycetes bacterium]|nr:YggS family pyridoxal phosphate-dependent enzyme [Planctomycetota bacterium]